MEGLRNRMGFNNDGARVVGERLRRLRSSPQGRAVVVGANIVVTGYLVLRRSATALLDAALPPEDAAKVHAVVERYQREDQVEFGRIKTREAGRQRFIYVTVRVPADWSVRQGHDLADRLERDLAAELPGATTFTHVEPIEG